MLSLRDGKVAKKEILSLTHEPKITANVPQLTLLPPAEYIKLNRFA
jgi:hypothetical protein